MKQFVMAVLLAVSMSAYAQVDVKSAWARPTVAGQLGTGAFMHLTSKDGARVIGASSAVAGVVEIHEMKVESNVMQMRPISALELPPGRTVELKRGGHHMMLMDLKRPLVDGDKITVELRIETRDKKLVTQPVEVEIRRNAP